MQSAPYLQQISAFDAAAAGLKERDLQVITQTSAPAFRARLVGKDGGVKLDRDTPMTIDALAETGKPTMRIAISRSQSLGKSTKDATLVVRADDP